MYRNVTCTWSVISSAKNGPTAVLYSKTSYVAFTRWIQQAHFHTQCCFISSIGQLWGDSLRDLLIDSGMYASVVVEQMMSGKQYKRAVPGLILMYEALMRCYMWSFFKWYEKDMNGFSPQFWQHFTKLQSAIGDGKEHRISTK